MSETSTQQEEIVSLSPAAQEKLQALVTDQSDASGIRLGVVGGGCAGLQYQMDPCKERTEEDLTQSIGEVTFYFHPMVVPYLKGITIDYVDAMIDGGFKFINPNAQTTCGCGTSFGI